MKKNIFLFVVLFSLTINSQTIIERLDSPDYSVRLDALIEIRDNHLTEYIDILFERTFNQPTLLLTDFFVDVLFVLEYEEMGDIIHQLIDICDQFPQENPLRYKVEATELLVRLDDFTTVDYVFEYVNEDPVRNGEKFISLLTEIAIKLPQHSEAIKGILINIKNNSQFYLNRKQSLENLILIFGAANLQAELLSSIVDDPSPDIRKLAMEQYAFPDRKDLLRQQIENDMDWYRRLTYSEIYLESYVEPGDLKFVKDYSLIEPDAVAKGSIENLVAGFIPAKPDTLDWSSLSMRLISYIGEIFQYGWITNIELRNFYEQNITEVYESVESTSEIEEACFIINETLLPQIEQDLDDHGITIEGYTFLHYYTVYIKEEIEEEFGSCQ